MAVFERKTGSDGRFISQSKGDLVGKIFESARSGKFKVLNQDNDTYIKIRFLQTGYERTAKRSLILSGTVDDPLYPRYYGRGYFGKSIGLDTLSEEAKRARSTWGHMLDRCYNKEHNCYGRYGKRGCEVAEEWWNFQNYLKWYLENHREGFHIDKDVLVQGNKIYGPDTCKFVPTTVNAAVHGFRRGGRSNEMPLPAGVKLTSAKRYAARFRNPFTKREEHLGVFDKAHPAFMAYKNRKEEYLRNLADLEYSDGRIDSEVRDALYNWNVLPY